VVLTIMLVVEALETALQRAVQEETAVEEPVIV
jgi:hypothetical protein